MSSDSNESLTQRLAQPAVEHKLQLIVQQLRQVWAYSLCEHPNALEDWFFLHRVLLPTHMVNQETSVTPYNRTLLTAVLP